MDFGKVVSKRLGNVVDQTVKTSVSLAGKGLQKTKLTATGKWVEELAPIVGQATGNTVKLVGTAIDGAVNLSAGVVTKDDVSKKQGTDDLKNVGSYVYRDLKNTAETVVTQGLQATKGVAFQDRERAVQALKEIGKTIVAGSSGTPFEKPQSKLEEDEIIARQSDSTFPQFHSYFEVTVPETMYKGPNKTRIQYCNEQLAKALKEREELAEQLALTELDKINVAHLITPEGYVWHHDEIPGVMMLVEETLHAQMPHISGKVFWT